MEQLDPSKYVGWEFVGEGGYAKVYKALDTEHQIDVAIKQVRYSAKEFEDHNMKRFDEIEALQSIDRYVPQYYGYWIQDTSEEQNTFIVQQFIYGETVEQLYYDEDGNDRELTDGDWERLWIIAGKLLEAVVYINSLGWVHRDLSPSNIMWTGSDVVIIDLGMARRDHTSDWGDVSMIVSTIKNAAQIVVAKDESLHPVQDRIRALKDFYMKHRKSIITSVEDLLIYYRQLDSQK